MKWVVIMISFFMLTSCGGYNVLAGKIDMGVGFTINPCKVEVTGETTIEIVVENQTDESKTFLIATRLPDSYCDGYLRHFPDDAYELDIDTDKLIVMPWGRELFNISVAYRDGIKDNREAWVSVKEVTKMQDRITGELIVRVLMKGGENR